jgi:hypothetical protein
MVQKEEKKRLRMRRRREARRRRENGAVSGNEVDTGLTSALETSRLREGRRIIRDPSSEPTEVLSGGVDIELNEITGDDQPADRGRALTGSSSSSDASPLPLESVSGIFAYPINLILRYVRTLRSGHEEATKRKVLRRAKLRQQVFEGQSGVTGDGWGLGSFGIREAEDSERRRSEANRIAREEQLMQSGRDTQDEDEEEILSAESDLESGRGRRPVQHAASAITDANAAEHFSLPDPMLDANRAGGLRGVMRKWRLVDRSTF